MLMGRSDNMIQISLKLIVAFLKFITRFAFKAENFAAKELVGSTSKRFEDVALKNDCVVRDE